MNERIVSFYSRTQKCIKSMLFVNKRIIFCFCFILLCYYELLIKCSSSVDNHVSLYKRKSSCESMMSERHCVVNFNQMQLIMLQYYRLKLLCCYRPSIFNPTGQLETETIKVSVFYILLWFILSVE